MFLLKLLGVGKFLRDFFFQNWKWLAPLILVIVGFLWTRDHYLEQGKASERLVWEERLEKERLRNEELTKLLVDSVTTFAEVAEARNESRVERETIIETRINTLVEDNPMYEKCKVDQEVVNEQNALKEMGP
jgi:hypothetical protein